VPQATPQTLLQAVAPLIDRLDRLITHLDILCSLLAPLAGAATHRGDTAAV
jgi:hypothetical protein